MGVSENAIELRHAEADPAIAACFPVLCQLRPHLVDLAALVAQIRRQQQEGYRLLAAWRGEAAISVAGYRFQENLIYGRFVYVDDLAVLDSDRGGGLGARLLDAVAAEATEAGCERPTGLVLGPVLDKDTSATVQIVAKLMDGDLPGLPRSPAEPAVRSGRRAGWLPLAFSARITPQPAARSACRCTVRSWSRVETRAYP